MASWEVEEEEGSTYGVINLEDVDENKGFDPVPIGVYEVCCERADFIATSKSGYPYINVMWSIQGNADEKLNGRKLFQNISLKPEVLHFLKRALMVLNPDKEVKQFNPQECEDYFLGNVCKVKVKTKKYEGKDQNEVKDILPLEGSFFD